MRKLFQLFFLSLFLVIGVTETYSQKPVEGTWKEDARTWKPQHKQFADADAYQIITPKRWISIGINPADQSLYWAIGGTYHYEDGIFTEKTDFFSVDTAWIGGILHHKVEFFEDIMRVYRFENLPGYHSIFFEKIEPSIATSKQLHPLIGVWEIEKAQYGDEKLTEVAKSDRAIKIITPRYFLVYSTSGKQFKGLNFGTCSFRDNKYNENVLVSTWDSSLREETQSFTWSINEEGQFVQQGELNSKKFDHYALTEISNRIE